MASHKKSWRETTLPAACAEKVESAAGHLDREALDPALDILAPLYGCSCQTDNDCADQCDAVLTGLTEPFQVKKTP